MSSKVLLLATAGLLLALCSAGTIPSKFDFSKIKPFPRPSLQPATTENLNVSHAALDGPSGRIVNGNLAQEGQFKYQVQVILNGGHFCGGSLIAPRIVLTAAHCVVDEHGNIRPTWQYSIHLGSKHRWEGGHYVPVVRISSHWGYGPNLHDDVAIMEMEWEVHDWNIQPIELIDHEVPDWSTITISGFGLEENNQTPLNLKWANFWLLPKGECERIMGWGYNALVCLGHPSYEGACSGDSGGPGVYNNKLVGVTSFVLNGCAGDLPDGYSSVLYHRSWIFQHM